MRRLRILFSILFLGLLGTPLILGWLVLERHPAVAEVAPPTPEDAARAKDLVKRTWREIKGSREPVDLEVSEADLNGIAALIGRGLPRLRGRAEVLPSGVTARFTLGLRGRQEGPYVNATFGILPSDRGLELADMALGRVAIPPRLALTTLRFAVNWVTRDDTGDLLLAAVEEVDVVDGRLRVRLRPLPDAGARLSRAGERLRDLQGGLGLLADAQDVRVYYERLTSLAGEGSPGSPQSLADYLSPLFRFAASRSVEADAAGENGAAILALAVYFGDPRVERVIGEVRTEAEHRRRQRQATRHVTLGGRIDLRRHFVLSAAIELMSDAGMSHAVGEIKELLDAGGRGSGFSFVDLAADRAGVRFAEVATDATDASRLQRQLVAAPGEATFFPRLDGLPEGLDESEFAARFGAVDSPRYRELVAEIDRRIDALAAYGGGTSPR